MHKKKLKQLHQLLKWASQVFVDDVECLKAAIVLQEKCEQQMELLPDEERRSNTIDGFPLPPEVQGLNHAFLLFTDGACRGNPGPGSWGAMAQIHAAGEDQDGHVLFQSSGVDVPTTNNRMELMGAIEGLRLLRDHIIDHSLSTQTTVLLFSDSKYVLDGISKWMPQWKSRDWKKADNKTPENLDLWQELDKKQSQFLQLKFVWVKGHAGHPQNEHVDELANRALDEAGY